MPDRAKVRAVRMSDELWELVEEEAARQRISCAQFLREAAIWRLAYHGTSRGELDLDRFLVRFAALARRARRGPATGSPPGEPAGLPPLRSPERDARERSG